MANDKAIYKMCFAVIRDLLEKEATSNKQGDQQ